MKVLNRCAGDVCCLETATRIIDSVAGNFAIENRVALGSIHSGNKNGSSCLILNVLGGVHFASRDCCCVLRERCSVVDYTWQLRTADGE